MAGFQSYSREGPQSCHRLSRQGIELGAHRSPSLEHTGSSSWVGGQGPCILKKFLMEFPNLGTAELNMTPSLAPWPSAWGSLRQQRQHQRLKGGEGLAGSTKGRGGS